MPIRRSDISYSSTRLPSISNIYATFESGGDVTELSSDRLHARYRPHGEHRLFWHLDHGLPATRINDNAFQQALAEGDKLHMIVRGHEPFVVDNQRFTYTHTIVDTPVNSDNGSIVFRSSQTNLEHFDYVSVALSWAARTTHILKESLATGDGTTIRFTGVIANRWYITSISDIHVNGIPLAKGREYISIATTADGRLLFGERGLANNPDPPALAVNSLVHHPVNAGSYVLTFASGNAPADGADIEMSYNVRPMFMGNLNVKLVKTPYVS